MSRRGLRVNLLDGSVFRPARGDLAAVSVFLETRVPATILGRNPRLARTEGTKDDRQQHNSHKPSEAVCSTASFRSEVDHRRKSSAALRKEP